MIVNMSIPYVTEIMQKLNFQDIQSLKKEWGNNELNVIGFTDSILKRLALNKEEKLSFTKGIVEMFRHISIAKKGSKITFSDCDQYFTSVRQVLNAER